MSFTKAALQHTTQFPISVRAVQRTVAELRDIHRILTLEGNYIARVIATYLAKYRTKIEWFAIARM